MFCFFSVGLGWRGGALSGEEVEAENGGQGGGAAQRRLTDLLCRGRQRLGGSLALPMGTFTLRAIGRRHLYMEIKPLCGDPCATGAPLAQPQYIT